MASSGEPAGSSAAASAAPSGGDFVLSAEFIPIPEAPVQCVIVLDNDTVATGGDDHLVTIWKRTDMASEAGGEFAASAVCPESSKYVRALAKLPVSATLPAGGFAAGSMDNEVRVYSLDGTLVRTLAGHSGGVLSLSVCPDGSLVSGSWDGSAKVWNVDTGACTATLGGMENAIAVLAMPNGDIVAGSTGAKNEAGEHKDYQIRVWRDGAVVKTLKQHAQAVRCLAALPSGGFVSASNDGTVRVWSDSYDMLTTFTNPVSGRGEVPFCYRVAALSDGTILSSSEDGVVRVIDPATCEVVQNIQHPAVCWGIAEVPGGGCDMVTVGQHPGTSSKGHVYLWTRDHSRGALETVVAQYERDCVPPKPASSSGGGGGGGLGPNVPALKIKGKYEKRATIAGSADGEQGFFKTAAGGIMMCTWSAAAGSWADVGEVQGTEDDGPWDVTRTVTLDLDGGGLKTCYIKFNAGEDSLTVAKRFCVANEIPTGYLEQIRDYVMKEMESASAELALAGSARSAAAGRPAKEARRTFLPRLACVPVLAFTPISPIQLDKVKAAIVAKSAEIAAGSEEHRAAALTVDDVAALDKLFEVVAVEAMYHSSVLPARGAGVVVAKIPRWPTAACAAGFDLLRKLCLHTQGAATYIAPAAPGIVEAACRVVTDPSAGLGPITMSLGLLSNLLVKPEPRAAVLPMAAVMADAAAAQAAHERPMVRARAAILLHNLAAALAKHAESAGALVDSTPELDAGAERLAAAAVAILTAPGSADATLIPAAAALGTAVLVSSKVRASAEAKAAAEAVAAAAPAGSQLKQVANDAVSSFSTT